MRAIGNFISATQRKRGFQKFVTGESIQAEDRGGVPPLGRWQSVMLDFVLFVRPSAGLWDVRERLCRPRVTTAFISLCNKITPILPPAEIEKLVDDSLSRR
jgi:hypothetical protein